MRQEMQHLAGEAADCALLHRDRRFVFAGKPADEFLALAKRASATVVERPAADFLCREQAILQSRAEGEQRDLRALSKHAALSPAPEPRSGVIDADPVAARMAEKWGN